MARSTVVRGGEAGVYHCVTRCVRRAFLCGRDGLTGKDFEHRREWIRGRLRELTEIFAVEVMAYAVMANHVHVVLRVAPERARGWSFEELAGRWCRLFPKERDAEGRAVIPTGEALRNHFAGEGREARCRERLADLSWFMRCLNEPIARRANREDGCTGRFWEGRFKCQRLTDAGAVLACMAYVDLNPVRAGLASTPEGSDYTSGQDRLVAARARAARERLGLAGRREASGGVEGETARAEALERLEAEARRDDWLARLGEDETETVTAGVRRGEAAPTSAPRPRMTAEAYLALLDWTGRGLRAAKRGSIPGHLAPLLERMELATEAWVETVERYGSLYARVAGSLERLGKAAREAGQKWFRGVGASLRVYRSSAVG
jgi:REP element-mobilizing transposase RayT